MTERIAAIVPAAGTGSRLAEDEPAEVGQTTKALRLLAGEPLLRHAIRSLEHVVAQVVVPTSAGTRAEVEQAVAQVGVPVVVVEGGATREESVRRSLAALDPATTHVLVHDAARPLTPAAVTDRVVAALRGGARAVVPVVEVVDTLRRTSGTGSHTIDRAEVRAVQTPQGFSVDVLRRAHDAATSPSAGPSTGPSTGPSAGPSAGGATNPEAPATDDASMAERLGVEVVLVDGDPRSFKITRALDLALAQAVVGQST